MTATTSANAPANVETSAPALDLFKVSIKLFADAPVTHASDCIQAFHKWIQSNLFPEHLLIDVANYDHVVDGPGVVLVAHEANISLDRENGRPGLLYFRKQPLAGDFTQRLRSALRYTVAAAQLLQQSLPEKIRFRTDELRLRFHDRLLAPNTRETFAAIRPSIESVFAKPFNNPAIQLVPPSDELLSVQISAQSPRDLAAVLVNI